MARTIPDIRNDIERAVRARHDIYRQQAEVTHPEYRPELAERREALDFTISRLWDELRHSRVEVVKLADFTPADVRRLVRHNPLVMLA